MLSCWCDNYQDYCSAFQEERTETYHKRGEYIDITAPYMVCKNAVL